MERILIRSQDLLQGIPAEVSDDQIDVGYTAVVLSADAQATIADERKRVHELEKGTGEILMIHSDRVAALQARVNGLEKDSELLRQSRDGFRVKYESAKNDAITLQSQLTQRTVERDTARRRVDELEAREVDVVTLREDLEQRTAELEAAKADKAKSQPGGEG